MSDHYDGKRFFNPGIPRITVKELLKWTLTRKPPKRIVKPSERHSSLKLDRSSKELCVTFINHSTVLIQCEGKNILTDPIWSKRCSPFNWIGPRRLHPPGIPFEGLPPIDYVLLSHNHYDHLDLPTIKKLQRKFKPQFLTGLGNKKLLYKSGIKNVIEMDWWQEISFKEDLTIAFVPAQHHSGRKGFDLCKTLWGGFIINFKNKIVYFAGDTAYGPLFNEIRKRYGSPDLALLPIGAYKPRWIMKRFHQSPEEAVMAHIDLKAKHSLGIHHGTFLLSDETAEDPEKDLKKALRHHKISEDLFFLLSPGESRVVK